ncbi:MAG: gas vesicle protein GvpD P-loop domain-containing protein [Thermoplasmatota archaeon]
MKDIKGIPKEIIEFLNKGGGSSLFLKGSAGTGKTTLALQLIEEMGHPDKSFYLSTRVSDQSLYKQFPWLEEKEMKSRVLDSSKIFLETIYEDEKTEDEDELPESEKKKIESARKFLDNIEEKGVPEKVDRTHLNSLDEKIPALVRIYDRIDNILPERPMLVIDSVEGITSKYGIDQENFIMTLQKDLAENSNTNLILVLEKSDAKDLEYLVDGVVELDRYQLEKRNVREIHLIKLRGIGIKQPSYLMTLNGGRFKCFEPYRIPEIGELEWEALEAVDGKYSTGTKDLDDLLDGGFDKGTYNVFEVKENVSNEEYFSVIRPIFLNFLTRDRGVLAVLSGGTHPRNLRDDLVRFVNQKKFNQRFRLVDYFSPKSDEPYIMALGGKSRDEVGKIYTKHMKEIRGDENRPILEYTGFDTMEYLMGNEIAIKELLEAVANTKASNKLGIGIVKHGLKVASEIKNMADNYFVIASINKTPCIYGIKPKTGLYAIVSEEKRIPHIDLVPIM